MREWKYSGREQNKQKTVKQLADGLVTMLDGIMPEKVILDPSATALKVELKQRGYSCKDADNDVVDGIADVQTMLAGCLLLFMASCKGCITEFGQYAWDSKAADRGEDKPIKVNDHSMDAVRYFVRTMRLVKRTDRKPYRSALG